MWQTSTETIMLIYTVNTTSQAGSESGMGYPTNDQPRVFCGRPQNMVISVERLTVNFHT